MLGCFGVDSAICSHPGSSGSKEPLKGPAVRPRTEHENRYAEVQVTTNSGMKGSFHCRRCNSTRVGKLKKQADGDNDVFRCLECGHIFSPAPEQGDENVAERRGKDA